VTDLISDSVDVQSEPSRCIQSPTP